MDEDSLRNVQSLSTGLQRLNQMLPHHISETEEEDRSAPVGVQEPAYTVQIQNHVPVQGIEGLGGKNGKAQDARTSG